MRKIFSAINFLVIFIGIASSPISVADSCYALTSPRLSFSSYDPLNGHAEDIDATIDFYCEPAFHGTQLNIKVLVQGSDSGTFSSMRNTQGDLIRFSIFYDPARNIPLSSDMPVLIRDINFATKTFRVTLYGRIFANQKNAGAGNYQGNLMFFLEY